MSSLRSLAAAALAVGAAGFGRTCFDAFSTLCLQAETDATSGTVTFNATCTQSLFQNPGCVRE